MLGRFFAHLQAHRIYFFQFIDAYFKCIILCKDHKRFTLWTFHLFYFSCKSKKNRVFYGWKLIHVLWGARSETWIIEALAQVPCLSLWFHYITHFNRNITQRGHVCVSEELLNNTFELNGSKFNLVKEQCFRIPGYKALKLVPTSSLNPISDFRDFHTLFHKSSIVWLIGWILYFQWVKLLKKKGPPWRKYATRSNATVGA